MGDAKLKGPFGDQGIEGPIYADRVGGLLTYLDWDKWDEADKAEYAQDYQMHLTQKRMWADMDAGTFSLSDLS